MTRQEDVLLFVLEQMANEPTVDCNAMAVVLQTFIAEEGPLSEDAGAHVRELLNATKLAPTR